MSEPLCPYFRKPCLKHGCTHYVGVLGNNPQTGVPVKDFMCLDHAKFLVAIEGNREIRHVSGETNAFRNDMVAANARAFLALEDKSDG